MATVKIEHNASSTNTAVAEPEVEVVKTDVVDTLFKPEVAKTEVTKTEIETETETTKESELPSSIKVHTLIALQNRAMPDPVRKGVKFELVDKEEVERYIELGWAKLL